MDPLMIFGLQGPVDCRSGGGGKQVADGYRRQRQPRTRFDRRRNGALVGNLLLVITGWYQLAAIGQDAPLAIERIAENLRDPFGIAIQPDSESIFVAERGGYQIIRLLGDQVEPVIQGFRADGPRRELVGPLLFVDASTLVVLCKSMPEGEDEYFVFSAVPKNPGRKIGAGAAQKYRIGRRVAKELLSELADLTASGLSIFIAGANLDGEPGLGKGSLAESRIQKIEPLRLANINPAWGRPTAIADSSRGHLTLAVASKNGEKDSCWLTFWDDDGNCLGESPLAAAEIRGLAYHPDGGRLFGIGRIDDRGQPALLHIIASPVGRNVRAVKVVELSDPRAMVFTKSGDLLLANSRVATSETEATTSGEILRISGLDQSNPSWLTPVTGR